MLAIPLLARMSASKAETIGGRKGTGRIFPALMAAIFLFTAPGLGRADLTDGLIGYWPFDGDGADYSGGGYDLDLYGGVGFADGLFGQALDLHHDRTQFAQRPGDDAICNFGRNDFTIQVWVNFNDTTGEQTLIEKFQGAGGPGWTLTKLPADFYGFYVRPNGASVVYFPELIATGVWHQVVVRSSGNLFEMFYDGVLVASDVNENPVPDTSFPLLVGKRDDASGQRFPVDGRICEVAIWQRALDDDEIAFLWNDGNGNPVLKR